MVESEESTLPAKKIAAKNWSRHLANICKPGRGLHASRCLLSPAAKRGALRDGALLLFAYANYANYLFVCLSVVNAYLSGNGLNDPAAQ